MIFASLELHFLGEFATGADLGMTLIPGKIQTARLGHLFRAP